MGGHVDLFVHDSYNVAQFDYGCGPNSGLVPDTGPNGDDEDNADEEGNDEYDEDVDDECDGDDGDVEVDGHASSFRTFNQVLENEQGIYVFTQAPSCDVSNHPDDETLDEPSPVNYHLPPTPQFQHVENLDNAVASCWTPWVQHTTSNSSGEFVIGQVFNSKSDLQEATNIYSIKAHQEYVVVASSKKLLVLRCKKAEECHCPWKLRAMVVKDTSFFFFYQQIYWAAYLCQSLLELGPSSTRLAIGCYSYKDINSGTIHIDYGCYSGECDGKMGISNIIQKGVGWKA